MHPRRPAVLRTVFSLAVLSLASVVHSAAPPRPPAKVPADHARKMAAGRELFAKQVRPLLVANCLKCHGDGKKRGGLDLATRETLLKGADSGPVVVPGHAARSKLF